MFLRLQAPKLATGLPAHESSNRTNSTSSGGSSSIGSTRSRSGSSSIGRVKSRRRRLSDSSVSTAATTIRPNDFGGCRSLSIFLDSNQVIPSFSSKPKPRERSINISEAFTCYESFKNVQTIRIHECSGLIDCNAQLPITKFLRQLPDKLNHQQVSKVIVYRQLRKQPPLQTATNAFIRSLSGDVKVVCLVTAFEPQAQFPPGDLELFRSMASLHLEGTFIRFDKPLPTETLQQVSLIDNYSVYSDKQAEQMFRQCKNISEMMLDIEYLGRVEWIPESVAFLHLKSCTCESSTTTSKIQRDYVDINQYIHVTSLVLELGCKDDIQILSHLRFPNLQELKLVVKCGDLDAGDCIDVLLSHSYPDTVTLDLPQEYPYGRCVSQSFAKWIVSLKVVPNMEPFRVDMNTIESMFPRLKVLDLSNPTLL